MRDHSLIRELQKRVTSCSGGSYYTNEGLVDHRLTFRNSVVLRAHISFDISPWIRWLAVLAVVKPSYPTETTR